MIWLTVCLASCAPSDSHRSVTALINATVLADTTFGPIPDATVLLSDGIIIEVGPRDAVEVPAWAEVIDLAGRYLVPGFVDTHAHVRGPRVSSPDGNVAGVITFETEAMGQFLRVMLSYGVTTFRNPATETGRAVALRDALAARDVIGPDMITAGHALVAPPAVLNITDVVTSPAEARAAVRVQHAVGVDLIKVLFNLPRPLVRATIEEAHALGLPVMGHLGATTWTEAIADGIDFITHTTPLSVDLLPASRRSLLPERADPVTWWELVDLDDPAITELIASMADAGVRYDPNLVADEGDYWGDAPRLTADPDLDLVPSGIRNEWERRTQRQTPEYRQRGRAIWPKLLRFVAMVHAAGVPISTSTDAPNSWVIPGKSLHREMELLAEAGISPVEVLTAATIRGAEALGLSHERGAITPGRRADLVVLGGNPLDDISNVRRVEMVFRAGQAFSPAALRTSR